MVNLFLSETNYVHTISYYIYFNFSACSGQLPVCAHHQENLQYLCDTGILHSVWVAVWSAGPFVVAVWSADQTASHTE